MSALCLGLAGVAWAQLAVTQFTLAWDHTVEKIRWEEDYRITPAGLELEQARVRGSGAGMEAPTDARFHNGSWHYQRSLPPLQPLRLGRSPAAGDYELCFQQRCQPMNHWLGPPRQEQPTVELWSCPPTASLDQ